MIMKILGEENQEETRILTQSGEMGKARVKFDVQDGKLMLQSICWCRKPRR